MKSRTRGSVDARNWSGVPARMISPQLGRSEALEKIGDAETGGELLDARICDVEDADATDVSDQEEADTRPRSADDHAGGEALERAHRAHGPGDQRSQMAQMTTRINTATTAERPMITKTMPPREGCAPAPVIDGGVELYGVGKPPP